MFEHVSAVKADYRGKTSDYQRQVQAMDLAGFNRAENSSPALRLYANATNEVRLKRVMPVRSVPRGGSEDGVRRCTADLPGSLVYSHKVQKTGEVVPAVQKRDRPKGLSRYAAGMLREGCAVIENECGQSAFFLTLTLPGSTQTVYSTAALHATEMLNTFMQRIREHHKEILPPDLVDGEPLLACGVWEFQKRGALHWHLCIGTTNKEFIEVLKEGHQKWWRKILEWWSDKTGVDLFERAKGGSWREFPQYPRCEFKPVKFSVGRYMSKYISKSAREKAAKEFAPPARFWYVSEPLKMRLLAERNFNAIQLISLKERDVIFDSAVLLAQEMGATVLYARNPISGELAVATMFFPEGKEKEFVGMLNEGFEMFKTDHECVTARGAPEFAKGNGESVDLIDAFLIFAGRPLDVESAFGADLCAPFSASEKGGGMR